MSSSRPKFIDSLYFVDEPGNWHLKPGAPPVVVREFKEFMEHDETEDLEPIKKLKREDLI